MKIKFRQSVSGPHYSFQAGETVEAESIPFGDGPRFLEAGIAEPIQEQPRTTQQPRPARQSVSR